MIGIRLYQKIIVSFKNKFSKKKRLNYYALNKQEIDNLKMDA